MQKGDRNTFNKIKSKSIFPKIDRFMTGFLTVEYGAPLTVEYGAPLAVEYGAPLTVEYGAPWKQVLL